MLVGLTEWATTMLDPVARRAGDPDWVARALVGLPHLAARLDLTLDTFELGATQALVLYGTSVTGACVLKLAPDATGLAREAAALAAWSPRAPRVLAHGPGFVLLEQLTRFDPATPRAFGEAVALLAELHAPGTPVPPDVLPFDDRLAWLTGTTPPPWCRPRLAALTSLAARDGAEERARGGTGVAHGDAAAKNLARRHDGTLAVLDPLACAAPLGFDLGYLVWSWSQQGAAPRARLTREAARTLGVDPTTVARWVDATAVLWASVGWAPALAHLRGEGGPDAQTTHTTETTQATPH